MASTKYAYLKSEKGEAPFYVHLTLDEKEQSLRVYYHWSFWKKEDTDQAIFQTWMNHFKNVEPLLTKKKKNNTLVVKRNSVKVRGRCIILSQMLKDIIGFTEKNTDHELPAKIECYANSENKMIEIELRIPYKPLGDLPHELRKLPIFTKNPDFESVRHRLTFFNMRYIKNKANSSEVSQEARVLKPESSDPQGESCKSSDPQGESCKSSDPQGESCKSSDDITLDPQFCQENQHPYGEILKTSENKQDTIATESKTENSSSHTNVGSETNQD